MGSVQVDLHSVFLNLTQTNTFPSEPVPMEYFVSVTIKMKAMEKCLCDGVLGEDAKSTADSPTKKQEIIDN